jgi:hypothetical protein
VPPHEFSKSAEKAIGEFRRLLPDDPARMKRRPTQGLGAVLAEVMVKNRIGYSSPEEAVRQRWTELVGEANAAYSHAARLEGRRLIVLVSHGVVRNELFLHRAEIVERIQKMPGCGSVTELHIRAS